MRQFDVAIIGGGVVGLATAMALLDEPRSLIVLEAEDRLAAHQSGHNSGVIHSGLAYRPGSLKARLCVEGRDALYRFCRDRGIEHSQCGKIVVAADESELPRLEELRRRGEANGLRGIRRLTPAEAREREPAVAGAGALLVPETGLVDFARVTEEYAAVVRERGGEVRTGSRVTGCAKKGTTYLLETPSDPISARVVVNCGGLQSDRLAKMCGVDPGIRILPFRGEYYELAPERRELVRGLIYPVPDLRFPFLGVHLTRKMDGRVKIGPNAVLALRREGYRKLSFSFRDAWGIGSYRGFWRMAARHWRKGLRELFRSFWKPAMVRAVQRLVPEIRSRDLIRSGIGVRAQAVDPAGNLLDDFRIVEAPGMVHVLNAPSPAATASIAIGREIARRVRLHLKSLKA